MTSRRTFLRGSAFAGFAPCFGMLPGVRGFAERFPIPLNDGRSVWRVSDAAPGQGD